MAPRGKKIKDGVFKQMEFWKGNRGLQIMVTMGWDGMVTRIGSGIGKTRKWMLRIPPVSAEKFLLTFWLAEVR